MLSRLFTATSRHVTTHQPTLSHAFQRLSKTPTLFHTTPQYSFSTTEITRVPTAIDNVSTSLIHGRRPTPKRGTPEYKALQEAKKEKLLKRRDRKKAQTLKRREVAQKRKLRLQQQKQATKLKQQLESKRTAQQMEKLSKSERPKKPRSSWMIYAAEQIKQLKQLNPDSKLVLNQYIKGISEKWRQLTATDKLKYEEQSKASTEQYKNALQQYQQSNAAKPKRPPPAFFLFLTSKVNDTHSRSLKERQDTVKLLSQQWKSMSDADKQPYIDQYNASKSQYTEQLHKYQRHLQELQQTAESLSKRRLRSGHIADAPKPLNTTQ